MNPEKLIIQFNALIIRYVNEASIGYEEVTLGRKPTVQKVLLNVRFRWIADITCYCQKYYEAHGNSLVI